MFKRLSAALYLRTVSRTLANIALALDKQTELLARLADRFAPDLPVDSPADRATVRADTGVSHLDADDASRALDFIQRMQSQTGHTPDDEEILIYLADEKTQDLQTRLAERDEQLTRLAESRR